MCQFQSIQGITAAPRAAASTPAAPLAYLFEDKKVWQDKKLREEQGKYPVIALTFKDIKSRTWEESVASELRARGIQTIVAYGIAVDGKNVLIKEERV